MRIFAKLSSADARWGGIRLRRDSVLLGHFELLLSIFFCMRGGVHWLVGDVKRSQLVLQACFSWLVVFVSEKECVQLGRVFVLLFFFFILFVYRATQIQHFAGDFYFSFFYNSLVLLFAYFRTLAF